MSLSMTSVRTHNPFVEYLRLISWGSDLREPLSHYGLDSIAFSQLRGRVAKEAQVNLPISFLSDAYSLRDIVDHIVRKASVAVV